MINMRGYLCKSVLL